MSASGHALREIECCCLVRSISGSPPLDDLAKAETAMTVRRSPTYPRSARSSIRLKPNDRHRRSIKYHNRLLLSWKCSFASYATERVRARGGFKSSHRTALNSVFLHRGHRLMEQPLWNALYTGTLCISIASNALPATARSGLTHSPSGVLSSPKRGNWWRAELRFASMASKGTSRRNLNRTTQRRDGLLCAREKLDQCVSDVFGVRHSTRLGPGSSTAAGLLK
jgi:hypothetical protein